MNLTDTPPSNHLHPTSEKSHEGQGQNAAVCPICKCTKFVPGPFGRLSVNGTSPQCAYCQSLERHRIARVFFETILPILPPDMSALQISHDRSIEADWFKSYELSVYGKLNSIDLEDIDRPDGAYDLIICNHVLEHIADDRAALRELSRILSDRGLLVLMVPSPHHRAHTAEWGFPDWKQHGHYRVYGLDALPRFPLAVPDLVWHAVEITDPVTLDKDFVLIGSRNDLLVTKILEIFDCTQILNPKIISTEAQEERIDPYQIFQGIIALRTSERPLISATYLKTHSKRFLELVRDIQGVPHVENALDIAGTDFTTELLKACCPTCTVTSLNNIDVEKDQWPTPDEHYDLAIMTEVIEHLGVDPAHAIWNACRSLKLGGRLILTTVNLARLISAFNLLTGATPYVMGGIFGHEEDRHDREYVPVELAALVAMQGFNVELSTFDCYERTEHQRNLVTSMQTQLGLDLSLRRDTIKVVGTKVTLSQKPRRIWPVYHHSVSENRVEQLPEEALLRIYVRDAAGVSSLNAFANRRREIDRPIGLKHAI